MNTTLSVDDMLKAARIGTKRIRLFDPAIGRDDAHQEICLMLLQDESISTAALAIWVSQKRVPGLIKPAHSRHRLKQAELEEFEYKDKRSLSPVDIVQNNELREIIKTASLTKAQRRVVDAMMGGNTPAEICKALSMSPSSFANLLSAAIKTLRVAVKSEATGSVRLGRCKAAGDESNAVAYRPVCGQCGADISDRSAGAMYCSNRCKSRNFKRSKKGEK